LMRLVHKQAEIASENQSRSGGGFFMHHFRHLSDF
jgi:hypothetical protein